MSRVKHEGLRLYDAALTYIEHHPSEWNQEAYRCNTGMCIAGHIAITLAGGELINPSDPTDEYLRPIKGEPKWDHETLISERAKRLLGTAYIPGMFDSFNDLDSLRNYREEAARKVGEW